MLPRVGPTADRDAPPEARAPIRRTVLVVDDEPTVRRAAARLVSRAGYRALEADGGPAALALVEAEDPAQPIDAVLLDLTMPGMTGEETLARLRRLRPRLPVVVTSGREADGAPAEASAFVAKPFDFAAVHAALRRAVGDAP
jgi:two-component system cell cycle sensor histidine kinase/response regulator CckA